jgi:hypothetical protein
MANYSMQESLQQISLIKKGIFAREIDWYTPKEEQSFKVHHLQ